MPLAGLQRRPDGSVKLLTRTQKPPALVRDTPKKSRPRYKLSNQMRVQVKKICNGMEETNQKQKVAFGTGSGVNYTNHDFPGIPANQGDIMRLIPTVDQGDERDERDGAKIRITSLTGSFFAHVPAAYTPSNQTEASAAAGLSCRLLILSCKQVQALGQFEQNWAAGQNFNRQFLKNGSQATGFNGDLFSLRWPVNTQLFTKHYDRYFTLNRGIVNGNDNHKPEVFKNIRFRIKCKNKMLQFNEPSTNNHTNWSLFAVLLYAPNDSSLSSSSPGPVKGNMYCQLSWKE
jgi:hypothetical protein